MNLAALFTTNNYLTLLLPVSLGFLVVGSVFKTFSLFKPKILIFGENKNATDKNICCRGTLFAGLLREQQPAWLNKRSSYDSTRAHCGIQLAGQGAQLLPKGSQ